MSLIDRLKKNSKLAGVDILSESTFFQDKKLTPTPIPILNIIQSGEIDGGFGSGLTTWAGPSKHFKTSFLLTCLKSYLDAHKDSIAIFYDSEFGAPQSYFASFGIPLDRVLHVPVTNIEELKFDLVSQLDEIKNGDKVFIAIDSIGNLASKKEVEDALDGKSAADMTRAKALKGLFRIVTPSLTLKNIPLHVINHTYKEIGLYPKDIVGGGTGIMYSSDNVYIIGRQQEKTSEGIVGYNFIVNVEKSRFVREKSKLPVEVTFEGGISKWSGLLDLAIELGYVVKPSNGWFAQAGEEKKWRRADTNTAEFWTPILTKTDFGKAIADRFKVANVQMIDYNKVDYETGEIVE